MTEREQVIAELLYLKHDCLEGSATDQTLDKAIALLKAQEPITGETSDGYHTFNELYHHRAVLFSVIVNNYKDLAWKSVRHHDGTMYDGMFIVGIDTPDGQATYHYDINPYWDMFKCRVREFAPEWDGHTPAQAIERIGKLKAREPRVLMVEEVVLLKQNDVVWLEDYNKKDVIPAIVSRMGPMVICIEFALSDRFISVGYDDYGKRWRCWTSRPTDEQREATPWE